LLRCFNRPGGFFPAAVKQLLWAGDVCAAIVPQRMAGGNWEGQHAAAGVRAGKILCLAM